MEVLGIGETGREDGRLLLAFGFGKELHPPACKRHEVRLVDRKALNAEAPGKEDIPVDGVADRRIGGRLGRLQFGFHLPRALHKCSNVDTGHGHGKEADRGKDRESAAYGFGEVEEVPAVHNGKLEKLAGTAAARGEDPL